MKLKDLFEDPTEMHPVNQYEPSGVASPVPMPGKGKEDRSRSLRRHWIIRRELRRPTRGKGEMKGDSVDIANHGKTSAVNGPFK